MIETAGRSHRPGGGGPITRREGGADDLPWGLRGLGGAWGELGAWVADNEHTPAADLWERYIAGPESNPDPATWCTELNRPLID